MDIKDVKFISLGASNAWKDFADAFEKKEGYDIRVRGPFDNMSFYASGMTVLSYFLDNKEAFYEEYKHIKDIAKCEICCEEIEVYDTGRMYMWPEDTIDIHSESFAKSAEERIKNLEDAFAGNLKNTKFIFFTASPDKWCAQASDMALLKSMMKKYNLTNKIIFVNWKDFHSHVDKERYDAGENKFCKFLGPTIELAGDPDTRDITPAIEQFKEQIKKYI